MCSAFALANRESCKTNFFPWEFSFWIYFPYLRGGYFQISGFLVGSGISFWTSYVASTRKLHRSIFKPKGSFLKKKKKIENNLLLLQTQYMCIIESKKNTNKQKIRFIKTLFLLPRGDSCSPSLCLVPELFQLCI